MRPLNDHILVKRIEADSKSKGGIIIPETAKEKPQEGKVLAVGPGKVLDNGRRQEPSVKVGDKVLFGKYSGTEFSVLEKDELVIREGDILAVLED